MSLYYADTNNEKGSGQFRASGEILYTVSEQSIAYQDDCVHVYIGIRKKQKLQ